jgi:AraC-like DNA-binding protein
MEDQQAEREAQKARVNREELVDRIARAIPRDGAAEPIQGLVFRRESAPVGPLHGVSMPAFCVIAQGSKEVLLGEERFRYDPYHYLLATLDLPTVSQVVEASPEQPYLSVRLTLDPALVGSVMLEAGRLSPRPASNSQAMNVSPLTPELLDATVRVVRLMDSPDEARILAPLAVREIVFRLLVGEQGERLRHMAILGGHGHRIARAVERLREGFDQPLRIDDLARELGMSASGFHAHFKAVTAMSPLQFQKQIRLQEARRLMLSQDLDAASAGFRVGYDDASQFSREYRRLFGEPPMRDVARLREAAVAG